MITKCDHPGCTKAGTCRAPKTRDLKEYWMFCKEHAAEYNKNWNYYANMTPDEIDAEWERETFGIADKDKETANKNEADYVNFINDFLNGRSTFDKMPAKKSVPSQIVSALHTFDLPITATPSSAKGVYIQSITLSATMTPGVKVDIREASVKETA